MPILCACAETTQQGSAAHPAVIALLDGDGQLLNARGGEQGFKFAAGTFTKSGYTPLMLAVSRSHNVGNGVVKLLLDRGADMRMTDSQG